MASESMYILQPSFAAGEVSPEVSSRVDLEKYGSMLVDAKNVGIRPYGALYKRGGTTFCGSTKYADKTCILKPFTVTSTTAYLLEIGHLYIRVWLNDVRIDVEVVTPFTESELKNLRFCQSADVMYIVSGTHPVQMLLRYSATNWVLNQFDMSKPYYDATVSGYIEGRTIASSGLSGNVTLNANGSVFSAGMVGGGVTLQSSMPSVTITANGTQTTGGILCGESWKILTHGTWTGSVKVQKSLDNVTWEDYREYKSNNDFNATESGTVDEYTYLRLVSTMSSGSADLTILPYTHEGTAIITAVTNTTTAQATVKKSFGNTNATEDYIFSSWNSDYGYPSCVAFFQDRLCFASSAKQPYMVWMSKTGDYNNFSVEKTAGTVTDDSAIALSFISRQQQKIQHIVPASDLIVMTDGNEWIISGAEVVTPTKATPKVQTSRGSTNITPIIIGNRIIYVQRRGKTVRDMGYSFESDSYDGMDLTLLAKHITSHTAIIDGSYMQDPDNQIFFVLDSGRIACLAYVQDQKIYAWSQFITDGNFESVCDVESDSEDTMYTVVKREVNGETVRYIERFNDYPEDGNLYGYIMTDSAVKFDLEEAQSEFSIPHLAGKIVDVVADGQSYDHLEIGVDGTLTIPMAVKRCVVGLEYVMEATVPNVDFSGRSGTIQTQNKKVASVTLRLTNSLGGQIGVQSGKLDDIRYDELEETEITLFSGDKKVTMPNPGIELFGKVYIRSDDPFPFTLSAMVRETVMYG